MESFLQQWFKSAGRGVSRVKEAVHLAAGWSDLAYLDENDTVREVSIHNCFTIFKQSTQKHG